MGMKLEAWCKTDPGLKRDQNQDFFLVDDNLQLYIVADGMGGHRGGEEASRTAAAAVKGFLSENRHLDPEELLKKAYLEACQKVFELGEEKPELKGMGTTMVALYVFDDIVYIANVGDSRAYLSLGEKLWQMTEDHSLVNEQLYAGLLKEKDIASFPGKNIITRSIGYEPDVNCDIYKRALSVGEKYLLCSDGLTGMISDMRIADILHTMEPEEAVEKCVEEANANGGEDNVTVVICQVEES